MAKAPTDIRSLARSYTDTAIKTLAGIMMERCAQPAARVAAAQALLDRGWGKAPATLTVEHKRLNELTDDELTRRLAELSGQLAGAIGDSEGDAEAAGNPPVTH